MLFRSLCLPSLYTVLLAHAEPAHLASLRVVMVAGEACPGALLPQHHARLPHARLYNEYGPTEGTVWCTAYQMPAEAETPVSIGRPIANAQMYILDTHLRPVPVGVP